MLSIKQSLPTATTFTALYFNADGVTVANQAAANTDHTVISGEMGVDTSANLNHHFNLSSLWLETTSQALLFFQHVNTTVIATSIHYLRLNHASY